MQLRKKLGWSVQIGGGGPDPASPPPSGCALASEEVILELVRAKFIPDGLESFQLGKADLQSLDFTFNRVSARNFLKLGAMT